MKVFVDQPASVIKLKELKGTRRVLYIFGDFLTATTEDDFRQIAEKYDGDVYYVRNPHEGYAVDRYCDQVIKHATSGRYHHIDLIGASIGAQTYATFYEQLRRFPLEKHFWMLFPLNSCTLQSSPKRTLSILMPILVLGKILLGLVGMIPFVHYKGLWYSVSEIVEELHVAIWDCPFWLSRPEVWHKSNDETSYWGHCRSRYHDIISGIVLAKGDELVDNTKVISTYKGTSIMYTDSRKMNNGTVAALHKLGLF